MLSALLLGGCSGATGKTDGQAAAVAPPRAEQPLPQPPRTKPKAAQTTASAAKPTPAAPSGRPAGEADPARTAAPGGEGQPRKQVSPSSLVGLDEAEMRRLLGEPTWAEDVPPGRYWQYASRSCVLRVFFFLEMDTQRFRALSYELTSTENAPNVDEQCLDQLLRQAPAGQAALLDRH